MSILRSKTFWTGLAGLVTAVGAYASGQAAGPEATQMALTSLLAIFLRAGLLKLPDAGRQD